MKNHNYKKLSTQASIFRNTGAIFIAILLISGFYLHSCQDAFEIIVSEGDPISISSSSADVILDQRLASNSALSLNWTRGTNLGTGSSISYTLEMDVSGNNFASAEIYDMGKGIYEKSFTGGDLNDLLIETWGIATGISTSFEARITAHISEETVEDDTSDPVTFTVMAFKSVSEQLFIVGTASPNGEDIVTAIELTPSATRPWEFVYQDILSAGSFRFAVSQDECWCQDFYTMDQSDEEMMVYNEGGVGDDDQWLIAEAGKYKIKVNLIDLSIHIERLVGPDYDNLYIVGDASPSGFDIATPQPFTPSADDPYIFTYEGLFVPGEFKISTFTGDWCDGDWLNAAAADQPIVVPDLIITSGCDGPDNKWIVTEETKGRYKITVNLATNTMIADKVFLYLIGDGGPNGWDIASPEPMTYADGIYTFTGELGTDNPTGEFKISKFIGNWCDGDWINSAVPDQSVSSTDFIYTWGCDGPDNKWRLVDGDAGSYVITVDLDDEVMTITKQ